MGGGGGGGGGGGESSLLLLLLLILLCFYPISAVFSFAQSTGLCVSPGGRFPTFSTEGKPPRRVSKGPKDLALCRIFRQNTCCDVTQTYPALLLIRRLASSGEASQECLHLWELLECSICDPRIGVQPGPPVICSTFCDMVFQACSSAYFSIDIKSQALLPCGLSDIICGRASQWVSNGTELCRLAGFLVQQDWQRVQSLDEPFCYGGKASLESISDSWKSPDSRSPEDFQQWVREMPIREKVFWAVGGMVLTAGLLLVSKRRSYSHRQKQAAIRRTTKRLEVRINQQSSARKK
ncbi:folate-binding protein 1 [Curcuma longa]|uniref:folate-binding protein 1 n=1 Tax=Curcuma longa TaxID=136217 RepID=UPI003D9EB977